MSEIRVGTWNVRGTNDTGKLSNLKEVQIGHISFARDKAHWKQDSRFETINTTKEWGMNTYFRTEFIMNDRINSGNRFQTRVVQIVFLENPWQIETDKHSKLSHSNRREIFRDKR